MMTPSRLFICLTLMLLSCSHNMVTAQCSPSNLETTEVLSTQLSISWRCFDRDANDELQMTYQLTNRGQCETGDGSQDPPFHTQTTQWGTWNRQLYNGDTYQYFAILANLLPYSTYRVSVLARQSNGAGDYNYGDVVYIYPDPRTSEAVPGTFGSGNITSTTQYAEQLDFQWRIPCSSRNGVITGYYYYWTHDYNGAHTLGNRQTQTTSFLTSAASITDLTCDTTYRFFVAGMNSAGGGLFSEIKTAATTCCTKAPGSVTNLQQGFVTATYIQVTWGEPTFKGCPIIDSYEVTCRGASIQSGCPTHNLEGQTTLFLSYTRGPARPYYRYTISVNPVGGPTQHIIVSTEQSAPDVAPASIELTSSSSSSVTLSWDVIPCAHTNGIITGYPYQLLQDGIVINEDDAATTSTSVTIQDLTPDTLYFFTVAAQTSAGVGPLSSGYTFRTRTVSVNPPTAISADSILNTSVRFSWNEASCPDLCPGGITSYSWRLLQSGVQIYIGTTDERSVTIHELIPCTEYEFIVAGASVDGIGSYSEGERATTAGEAPGMVVNLYINSRTRTSISIEWNAPSSSCAATSYAIEYRLTNRDQCEPIIDGAQMSGGTASVASVPSKTISGLIPYSTYEVYVHAVNSYGQGIIEASVITMTDADIPSAAPDNVTVTTTSRNSLSFSWDEVPCGSRHGVIHNYQYRLQYNDGSGTTGTTALGDTSDRMVTIMNGLSSCTTYKFRVRAISSQGIVSNTWSDGIEAVTTGAVDALTVVPLSATELAVSWTVPSESCATNSEYTVEYHLKTKDQCMELGNGQKEYGSVSGTSSVLTGLLPFSTYEVSVRVGMSVATEVATTQGSRPTGFPRNIRALRTTNSSITYSWTEPMCGERNGIIDKYTYTFLKTGSSPDLQHNNVPTSDITLAFSDLELYTEYSFIISANTKDGVGPQATFKHRTLEGVPSAPTSVTLQTGTKEGSIDIEWDTPDVTNGVITHYRIRYWKSDEKAVEIILAADAMEIGFFTLPGLDVNSTYNIQVQAQTSAGKGPWGDVEMVFVPPKTDQPVVSPRSSTGLIAGLAIAVILVIIIVIAITVVYRRRKASMKETPKETTIDENEIYDEIDAKKEMMAKQQQRSHTVETGYEVNLAMETKMSPRAKSDGSAYEDVNIKEESEYQGLDLDTVNEEQSYQDLKGNTAADKSAPQYANV